MSGRQPWDEEYERQKRLDEIERERQEQQRQLDEQERRRMEGWEVDPADPTRERNIHTGEQRQAGEDVGMGGDFDHESARYLVGRSMAEEREQLAAMQARDAQGLIDDSRHQAIYAQQGVAGLGAGGNAASLRGASQARGQVGIQAQSQLAAAQAQQQAYYDQLQRELAGRAATYEQALQAAADAELSKQAADQQSQREKEQRQKEDDDEMEQGGWDAVGTAFGMVGGIAKSERKAKRKIRKGERHDEAELLQALRGHTYEYKPSAHDGKYITRKGERYGPMVDEIRRTRLGRTIVSDDGRGIDVGSAALASLSLVASLKGEIDEMKGGE